MLGLAADRRFKQVLYGRGCSGTPPERLAIEQQLRVLTALDELLASNAGADCQIDGEPVSFAPVYTLREPDATGIGFLRFRDWRHELHALLDQALGQRVDAALLEPERHVG